MWCVAVWYGVVWRGEVRCGVVRCGVKWCGVVLYGAPGLVKCAELWCGLYGGGRAWSVCGLVWVCAWLREKGGAARVGCGRPALVLVVLVVQETDNIHLSMCARHHIANPMGIDHVFF